VETSTETQKNDAQSVAELIAGRAQIETELAKVIVGQKEVIEQILVALFSGGHCLITGAPGLAKTLLVKSIAQIFHLRFQRIQFTPDLMPADVTGSENGAILAFACLVANPPPQVIWVNEIERPISGRPFELAGIDPVAVSLK